MKTLLFAGSLALLGLATTGLTGCETFAGTTSIQAPPNSTSSGSSSDDTFNTRSGTYDEQTPVGVDNAAAAGR